MPENIDTKVLLDDAQQHNVGFGPGFSFSSRQGLRNYARLSFAYYDTADIEDGVERLAQVINNSLA